MRESKNEIWYVIPYGRHGKVVWTQSHPDNTYLWQRPYLVLHFVEIVYNTDSPLDDPDGDFAGTFPNPKRNVNYIERI
jgi:hypothetical protein